MISAQFDDVVGGLVNDSLQSPSLSRKMGFGTTRTNLNSVGRSYMYMSYNTIIYSAKPSKYSRRVYNQRVYNQNIQKLAAELHHCLCTP
jgi:hypothetical protein